MHPEQDEFGGQPDADEPTEIEAEASRKQDDELKAIGLILRTLNAFTPQRRAAITDYIYGRFAPEYD